MVVLNSISGNHTKKTADSVKLLMKRKREVDEKEEEKRFQFTNISLTCCTDSLPLFSCTCSALNWGHTFPNFQQSYKHKVCKNKGGGGQSVSYQQLHITQKSRWLFHSDFLGSHLQPPSLREWNPSWHRSHFQPVTVALHSHFPAASHWGFKEPRKTEGIRRPRKE